MELLSLEQSNSNAFILATDGAFSVFHSQNDQVWSVNLCNSDNPPFQLQTTYGLRAKSMRVFPNLISNNRRLTRASDFTHPPAVIQYTPATIRINFSLKIGLAFQFDCFMAEPDILIGDIKISNIGDDLISLTMELAAILVPMGKGIATRPEKEGTHQFITGKTDNLEPVLFMTGGPTATCNPYPALSIPVKSIPHQTCAFTWALVTKTTRATSLDKARKVIRSPWHRTAQVQAMEHASQTIQIKTGNPDWDAAFFLAQMHAVTHRVNLHPDSPAPCFIRSRLSDQAAIPDQDQDQLDDLTTLEAIHLAQVLLPAHADILSALVEKVLTRMDTNGRLPSRLNSFAFKQSFQECPLLANLCLELFEIHEDETFLQRVFTNLSRITDTWCKSVKNLESDGSLAWQNPQQCQLDTGLFSFDIWEVTGRGLNCQATESPSLAAMLYREVTALKKIAKILRDKTAQRHFQSLEKSLEVKIRDFWQDEQNNFVYRDHQSHLTPARELYYTGSVQERLEINKPFTSPQRLQLHLYSEDEHTKVCNIHFNGENSEGKPIVEEFKSQHIRWVLGRAHLTTHNLFTALHSISVKGLDPKDQIILETADLSQCDITCLLPLWSGGASQAQVQSILETQLCQQNPDLKFGIPETWRCLHDLPDTLPIRVNVLWNTLIIEGLCRQGYHQEAAVLFTKLMSPLVQGLQDYGGFYPFYDCSSGRPAGPRNAIAGLAPVRVFLQIAGIRLFSPNRVALWGQNPFPWPVEIQWQGLSLLRDGAYIKAIFPDGKIYESDSEKPILLKLG